ncbi:hypothetical protein [Rhodococcus sp. KB6]|uniref:hypothetical protein n=1 Tax=Rhodococcus sp. KB6 TaxID=1752066 RepID=UPI000717EAC5|nr:hypothetical protein [Rhodococcus sp. KB6]
MPATFQSAQKKISEGFGIGFLLRPRVIAVALKHQHCEVMTFWGEGFDRDVDRGPSDVSKSDVAQLVGDRSLASVDPAGIFHFIMVGMSAPLAENTGGQIGAFADDQRATAVACECFGQAGQRPQFVTFGDAEQTVDRASHR